MKTINNYTFFWKDKIAQWNIKSFTDVQGISYNCAEQYMMAQKSLLFNDLNTYKLIMDESDPANHQKLGRLIQNFNETLWIQHREEIVYFGNFYKFTQNPELKEILLSTGNTKLVEASPYDKIWGVGLSVDNPLILDQKNWNGLNLLGNILTRLRDNLIKQEESSLLV